MKRSSSIVLSLKFASEPRKCLHTFLSWWKSLPQISGPDSAPIATGNSNFTRQMVHDRKLAGMSFYANWLCLLTEASHLMPGNSERAWRAHFCLGNGAFLKGRHPYLKTSEVLELTVIRIAALLRNHLNRLLDCNFRTVSKNQLRLRKYPLKAKSL